MNWLGGFLAGAGAVALGVIIGKSGNSGGRRHRTFYRRRRRYNPGWRQRRLERETLAYLREARITLEALNNPKSGLVDAEFIEPVPANEPAGPPAASPEAKK